MNPEDAWVTLDLPGEAELKKVLERCVSVRAGYEVLAEGETFDQACEALKEEGAVKRLDEIFEECPSFRFELHSSGKHIPQPEALKVYDMVIDTMEHVCKRIPPVSLKTAKMIIGILVEHKLDEKQGGKKVPSVSKVLITREVCSSKRYLTGQLSLKRRPFLGTTTMDAELSLLMCTCAGVKEGSVVYDPFVGTGSILIAATALGALSLGSDINSRFLTEPSIIQPRKERVPWEESGGESFDWGSDEKRKLRVKGIGLRGRDGDVEVPTMLKHEKPKNIPTSCTFKDNFSYYGLTEPTIFIADAIHLPLVSRPSGIFDAIVCDPPYGIREGMGESIDEKGVSFGTTMLLKLAETASKTLTNHGRLLFIIPVAVGQNLSQQDSPFPEFNVFLDVPICKNLRPLISFKHYEKEEIVDNNNNNINDLEILGCIEQKISRRYKRMFIVLEKDNVPLNDEQIEILKNHIDPKYHEEFLNAIKSDVPRFVRVPDFRKLREHIFAPVKRERRKRIPNEKSDDK